MDLGSIRFVNKETCGWSIHPAQRYKIIEHKQNGGFNVYRRFYNVQEPLRYILDHDKIIDENELFKDFRKPFVPSENGLKILLVGDLCHYAERMYALEEQGHRLYGLWVERVRFGSQMVGPLPFGHVTTLSDVDWETEIETIKPDVIYALMSTPAIELGHRVKTKFPDIPFVWHFKEGPSFCLTTDKTLWDKLIDLYKTADGTLFLNEEARMYYECFLPETDVKKPALIFDGEHPKQDYFTNDFSAKLSAADGEPHTAVVGRDIGIGIDEIRELVAQKIHIHYHFHYANRGTDRRIEKIRKFYPDHIHLHSFVFPKDWVKVFSQYDAGWLHVFQSQNDSLPYNIGWDDLNLPARMNPLVAAGLPLIMKNNRGHAVAMQSLAKNKEIGIFYNTFQELSDQLRNPALLKQLTDHVMQHRESFSFDYHLPRLIAFFREVIENKRRR